MKTFSCIWLIVFLITKIIYYATCLGCMKIGFGINFIQLLKSQMWVLLYCATINHSFRNRRRANKTYHKGLTIFKPKSVLYLLCLWSRESTGSHKNFTGAIIIWNVQCVFKALYNNLKYHNLILFLLFYL